MAIPFWVPLALAAASAAANYAGQKKTDKARAIALEEARKLREEKSDEAAAAAKKTADLFADTEGKEAAAAQEQEAQYTEATQGAEAQATLADIVSNAAPSGATSYVAEEKAASDKTKSRLGKRGASMAKLNAFGDVMVGNEIASAKNRADIARAGTTMLGWQQNVLPLQLEAANLKGRNLHTLADVLQAASMVTGMASMTAPAGQGAQAAGQGANVARDTAALKAQAAAHEATRQGLNQAYINSGYGANWFRPQPGVFY